MSYGSDAGAHFDRGRYDRERRFWDALYAARRLLSSETFATRYVSEFAEVSRFVRSQLSSVTGKRILSIGGGVDRFAVELAARGNTVISVDISHEAASVTAQLAAEQGLSTSVTALVMNCEEMSFRAEFDVIVCKRSLHHMDSRRVAGIAINLLRPGGIFLAEEPICFLELFRWFHNNLPFHPDPVRTEDERELSQKDVVYIAGLLQDASVNYFDMLTRESLVFLFSKFGLMTLAGRLGRLETVIINRFFPALRFLSTYAVITGTR